jgi:hypothetical protein
MSLLGHSRPKWTVYGMSGLPSIATELTSLEVRFVPIATVSTNRKTANGGLPEIRSGAFDKVAESSKVIPRPTASRRYAHAR